MTQKDKQLLLTDLCGRLPYGVKCQITDTNDESFVRSGKLLVIKDIEADAKGTTFLFFNEHVPCYSDITEIKPYLRPMSSMTEEEKEKCNGSIICYNEFEGNSTLFDTEGLDYLNKNMFDYRGLISKGLAIEAPEGMYGKEEQQ